MDPDQDLEAPEASSPGAVLQFPDGFLWGASTAAHQVEGGNWNNDWWAWEHAPGSPCVEPSGDACDSWRRWAEDVELVAGMGLGTYRFSLEWSRIEPEEGEWSHAAVAHYRSICQALLERGIEPTVTFHHFTTPRWVAALGGWEDPRTADRFARFCERVTGELGDVLVRACTINEPNVVAFSGWFHGTGPPGQKDGDRYLAANDVLIDAHRKAVDAIRSANASASVGMSLAMSDFQAADGGEAMRDQIRHGLEDVFLDAVAGDDFLGVQTYTRYRIGPDGPIPPGPGSPLTTMGWEYRPEALETTLRRAWTYTAGAVPLLVTENGISTDDDPERISYMRTALQGVQRCLADGLDLRGYICWSLLDNFEWARGYGPRFGLVSVDRETFARTSKASARWFAGIARTNAVSER